MSIRIQKYKKARQSSGRSVRKRQKKNPWHSFFNLVGLTIAGFLFWNIASWISSTSFFAVDKITVSGTNYLTEEEIINPMNKAKGINIFKLKAADFEDELNKLPYVKEIRIYRELPSELHVIVEERELLALINTGNSLIAVDFDGNLVAPPRKGNVYDLPIISKSGDDIESLYEAVNFLRAAKIFSPEVYAKVSEVKLTGKNRDIYAFVDDCAKPVLVGRDNYKEKVLKLWLLMHRDDVDFKSFASVDLRFIGKVFFTRI